MVTINFEIEGFDLADIIKSVVGHTGVNINIYTLQEVSEIVPNGTVMTEVVQQGAAEVEEKIELIDDSLTFDERNDFALKMRENGSSWSQVGRALGITAKSASRRLNLHLRKRQNAKATSERKAQKKAEEMMKPEFTGITDEELIQGIHATISVKSSETNGRAIYLSSDYATVMTNVIGGKNYRDTELLREFKKTIKERCDNLFRKVGMCLGVGVAISGNTFDENNKATVQIMVVRPTQLPTHKQLVKAMQKAGLI